MRPCIVVLACSLFLGGCATTDGTRTDATVPEATPPSTPPPQPPAQQPEEFVARVDTIEAAGLAVTAGTDTTVAGGEILFSIQIGAYKEPANASAAQSHARERYTLPVLNEFQERQGLYRIRIGNFATREEAAAHLVRMRTAFPTDYRDSFILQLQR